MPVILALIDGAVTLYFQPEGYWRGDRSQALDSNPIVWLALRIHPLVLVPGYLGWFGLITLLIGFAPAWIGLRFHVLLVLGHTVAISGWLVRFGEWEIAVVFAIASLSAAVVLFLPLRKRWNSPRPISVRL